MQRGLAPPPLTLRPVLRCNRAPEHEHVGRPRRPPILNSTAICSPIPLAKEVGREEAFSEEQIIGFLREAKAGVAVK